MKYATLLVSAAAIIAPGLTNAQEDYPTRPIQMIVAWGAGGGTDSVARIIASQMQQELGVPVNVVNRTGGSGVVGHSAMVNADPDGYTLGLASVEITMMHWQGLTDLTYEDFEIIAMVNSDPGSIMVRSGEFEDAQAVLDTIREEPAGTLRASGTAQGGIWHVALAGWLLEEGIDPNKVSWVPSQGSAPAITDMVAGGVDFVTSSLTEGQAMMEAGRVEGLANMGEERLPNMPDVPTLQEAVGSDWTASVWRAVVAPDGIPEEIRSTLTNAVEAAYNSNDFQDFMSNQGLGTMWLQGDEAVEFVAESDENFGEVMRAAGLAQE